MHTYYVMAGTVPVLVHNTGGDRCDIEGEYFYRGVGEGHPKHADALEGRAVPIGGPSSPKAHVGGNLTDSPFTSWSHAEWRAQEEVDEWGQGSVVTRIPRSDLEVSVGPSRDLQVHDTDIESGFFEEEHLIIGPIDASEIRIGDGPWFDPRSR